MQKKTERDYQTRVLELLAWEIEKDSLESMKKRVQKGWDYQTPVLVLSAWEIEKDSMPSTKRRARTGCST